MSVALDANATAPADGNALTTIDLATLTVGSGSNRALIVQLCFSAAVTITAVNWDALGSPQACGLISSQAASDGTNCMLYGLVAPTSGNLTLRISWTGSADVIVNATAWTGVDQTGGGTSFVAATPATGSATPLTLTVSSATGNATMAVGVDNDSTHTASSQTETFNDTAPNNVIGAGSQAAGSASNVHSWTQGTNKAWAMVGVNIVAAGAGGPTVAQEYPAIEAATASGGLVEINALRA
jgi:hypothetical protein